MRQETLSDWRIVAGAAIALLVGNGPVMQFTFGIFLKPIEAEFGISRGFASLILTMGLLATALALPFAGRIADRVEPRLFSLLSILGFGSLLALIGLFADSVWLLGALVFMTGLVAAGHTPLPFVKLISMRFQKRRGLALACCLTGIGIGAAILPIFLQAVVSQYGWKAGYGFLGVAVWVIAGTSVFLTIPKTSLERSDTALAQQPHATERAYLRDRVFWLMVASLSLTALCANGVIAHLIPMVSDRGVDAQSASRIIIWVGLATIMGRLVGGILLDRFWAPGVAVAFVAAMAAGLSIIISGIDPSYYFIAAFIIGFGLGVEADLIGFLVSKYFPIEKFGEIFGALFGSFMLANSAGPLILGIFFTWFGGYKFGLIVFTVLLAISCILFFMMGAYRYTSSKPAGQISH
ncbi:MAG: MFS transporter [Brevundimonas sp.]|nr:MFS transporter [Brevundimonas sp.]